MLNEGQIAWVQTLTRTTIGQTLFIS